MNRIKLLIGLLIAVVLLSFSVRNVAAQSPSPAPVTEINSFEVFWPLSPGKVAGDSLYFLKSLKETVRGLVIFGTPQKLDYSVFLATKRMLEAEKLMKDGKPELAKTTLESAKVQLDKAESLLDAAKSSNQSLSEVAPTASGRLANIQKLALWLASTNSQLKDLLVEIGNKAGSASTKF